MNPILNTFVFLGLVEIKRKKSISKASCLTAFLIVLFFVILGKYLFELFGITILAIKITGSILLFYIGFKILQSKNPKNIPMKILNQTVTLPFVNPDKLDAFKEHMERVRRARLRAGTYSWYLT